MTPLPLPFNPDEFEAEFRRLKETLTELTVMDKSDVRDVFEAVANTAAGALQVGRVSLWRYNRAQSAIRCIATWHHGVMANDDTVISRDTHPVYWRRLHEGRTLPITDAAHDPALIEFRDEYIPRYHIGAMLDSSVRAEGQTFGIVCAEHIGGPREWTPLERLFVASVADRLGLVILMEERRQLEKLLAYSQKMEALGIMAGGLAHDFNNVLSVVLASADMALMGLKRNEDVREDVEAIRDAATRAAGMTRRLLTVARREPMTVSDFDLNALLRDAHGLARRLLPQAIALDLQLTDEPLVISADRAFVDQAVINLLTNAAQAMPGGGTITVTTALLESNGSPQFGMRVPAGRYVRLSVRDTGGGIEPEHLSRIFDPFFTTKGRKGTGLGLAVVYNGMQQLDGLVSVESSAGVGSSIHLMFLEVSGSAL